MHATCMLHSPLRAISQSHHTREIATVRESLCDIPSLEVEHEIPAMLKLLLIVICKLLIIYVL